MRPSTRLALCATTIVLAAAAHGRAAPAPAGIVVRYPSGVAPDPSALQAAISDPGVGTIVIEKGTQLLSSTLFVFKRGDLLIRGATGNPRDVVVQSSASRVFQVEQATGVSFDGLTIRTSADGGVGVFLNAAPGPTVEGFADDTSIRRCEFHAYVGVQASVRTKNLSVADSSFVSGPFTAGGSSGGAGVLWEDGPGLYVTRSKFSSERGVSALAAVFVRGAQSASSEGDRARHLLVTNNRVDGDFSAGFDLADVSDAVVKGNRISFPNTAVPGVRGRVGIVVRRAAATQVTEDYELRGNVVRRAHYGAWLLGVGHGTLVGNDFRNCASAQLDVVGGAGFGDLGGAVRVNLGGPCQTTFVRNDFRGLKSALTTPAIVLFPDGVCDAASSLGNRVDRGRALFGRSPP